MRVYKSYPQAFLYEIFIASITLLGVAIFGGYGLIFITLYGLRPIVLKIENKSVDETFWFKHYNIFKLSVVLTAATIIIVYFTADLYFNIKLDSDFLLKIILPYFLLIHGCVGTIYFKN
jgi:hypothetical protein